MGGAIPQWFVVGALGEDQEEIVSYPVTVENISFRESSGWDSLNRPMRRTRSLEELSESEVAALPTDKDTGKVVDLQGHYAFLETDKHYYVFENEESALEFVRLKTFETPCLVWYIWNRDGEYTTVFDEEACISEYARKRGQQHARSNWRDWLKKVFRWGEE